MEFSSFVASLRALSEKKHFHYYHQHRAEVKWVPSFACKKYGKIKCRSIAYELNNTLYGGALTK